MKMLENTVQSFSLGNLIQSLSLNSHLYMLKLSPVHSSHPTSNFLLYLFTWISTGTSNSTNLKLNSSFFCTLYLSLLFFLCSQLMSGITTRVFIYVGNVGPSFFYSVDLITKLPLSLSSKIY